MIGLIFGILFHFTQLFAGDFAGELIFGVDETAPETGEFTFAVVVLPDSEIRFPGLSGW